MAEDEDPLPTDGDATTTRQLIARLNQLEDVLRQQTARFYAIEQRLGIDFEPPRPPPPRVDQTKAGAALSSSTAGQGPASTLHSPTPEPLTPDSSTPEPSEPQSSRPDPARDEQASWQRPSVDGEAHARDFHQRQTPPAAPPTPPVTARGGDGGRARSVLDIENIIGGSWFNWLGILAITFGVAFFLKYAWDNEWVGPAARVVLGAAAGVGVLVAGEVVRRRGLRQFAYVISGGGILILYLSVYAAHDFKLIGQLPAVALMVAVTATAVLLSARYDALPIAILGLLGGFLTPILLSTGRDNQAGLFGYIALLDAGVLALAYFKRWRSLNYMSFILTLMTFVGWIGIHYAPPKLWLTIFFLTLFFLLYSALAIVHNLMKHRFAWWFDISLVIINATFFFGVSYQLLDDAGYDSGLGSFALVVSAFFVLLYYAAYRLHRADQLLVYSYLGAAVTFFTMAVSIQLDQHWVTMAWAMEGLMLTWVGLRSDTKAPRHAALIVLAIAVGHWFSTDARDFAFSAGGGLFIPLLNRRAASCAALVAAAAATAWLYRQAVGRVEERERATIITLMILGVSGLALTLLSLDINDYFEQRIARLASGMAGTAEEVAGALGRLENTRQFSLSAMWTFYGATLLVLGVVRRFKPLRGVGLLLIALTILKLLALDITYYDAAWHTLVFNQTFVALALMVMALAAVARSYARADGIDEKERTAVIPLAIAVANLLALAALSAEAMGYFERAQSLVIGDSARWGEVARLEGGKQFALTVIWTLYGTAATALGITRRYRSVRYAGLSLLAFTVTKLLFMDTAYSAAPWHLPVFNQTFASFALLVAALGTIVWLYARADEIDEDERISVLPCLVAAANLLAIVGLSAEAWGFFEARINQGAISGLAAVGLRDLHLAQQLSLSVIWTIYGGVMLFVGIKRESRLLRVMALLLLGLTTLKVFFWDLAALDRIYRIVSFIVLGAILLAVSYLYQKGQQRTDK
ncbi:MAG: DUF2339 domain-containing protein [Acidobacteriota bacterium]|nr:DUF2339 domain-containing protein [Acidobacteriota bacterium]